MVTLKNGQLIVTTTTGGSVTLGLVFKGGVPPKVTPTPDVIDLGQDGAVNVTAFYLFPKRFGLFVDERKSALIREEHVMCPFERSEDQSVSRMAGYLFIEIHLDGDDDGRQCCCGRLKGSER